MRAEIASAHASCSSTTLASVRRPSHSRCSAEGRVIKSKRHSSNEPFSPDIQRKKTQLQSLRNVEAHAALLRGHQQPPSEQCVQRQAVRKPRISRSAAPISLSQRPRPSSSLASLPYDDVDARCRGTSVAKESSTRLTRSTSVPSPEIGSKSKTSMHSRSHGRAGLVQEDVQVTLATSVRGDGASGSSRARAKTTAPPSEASQLRQVLMLSQKEAEVNEAFRWESNTSTALENFAKFYGRNKSSVSFDEVNTSCAGLSGWANAEVFENSSVDASRAVTLHIKHSDEEDLIEVTCVNIAGTVLANFALPPQSRITIVEGLLAQQLDIPAWALKLLLPDGTLLTEPYLDADLASLS